MLYYPALNKTRCCFKGLCTECFLQIKTGTGTRSNAPCPFCKEALMWVGQFSFVRPKVQPTLVFSMVVTPSTVRRVLFNGPRSYEERLKAKRDEQAVLEAQLRAREVRTWSSLTSILNCFVILRRSYWQYVFGAVRRSSGGGIESPPCFTWRKELRGTGRCLIASTSCFVSSANVNAFLYELHVLLLALCNEDNVLLISNRHIEVLQMKIPSSVLEGWA